MLWGGTVCKVPAKYIEVGEEDIDIGGNDSAEGGDEDAGVDDSKQQVIDLVHNFRYQSMEYSKKEYMTYMKAFCKKCVMYKKEHDMADQVPAFKENVQEALKAITSEWNEYCWCPALSLTPYIARAAAAALWEACADLCECVAMLTRTMTARAALSCVDTTQMASHSSITSWTASLPRSTKHDTIRLWLLYSYVYL